jgi:ubiquinone biosynthesis protein UbiJ
MFCAEIARMVESRKNLNDDWLVAIDLGLLRSAMAEVANYKLQIDRLESKLESLQIELNWVKQGNPNV